MLGYSGANLVCAAALQLHLLLKRLHLTFLFPKRLSGLPDQRRHHALLLASQRSFQLLDL
jgi:hypothetical protein